MLAAQSASTLPTSSPSAREGWYRMTYARCAETAAHMAARVMPVPARSNTRA